MSDEPRSFTLVDNDGNEVQVVAEGAASQDGELQQLLGSGYRFHERHNDETIEVYGFMPDSSERQQGQVRIGDLNQARDWHRNLYDEDLLLLSGNAYAGRQAQQEADMREQETRLREYDENNNLEAAAYGLMGILPGGAAIAPIANAFDTDFGRRISEVTSANPLVTGTVGLLGMVGGSGLARAALSRSSAALANQVSPGVTRSFAAQAAQQLGGNRMSRLAVENLAEEIYFNTAMNSLQQNPQGSAESILAGSALGFAIGLPFARGAGLTAMRGVRPTTPSQRLMSDARDAADTNRQATTATGPATQIQQALTAPGPAERAFLRVADVLASPDPNLPMFYRNPEVVTQLQRAQDPAAVSSLADDFTSSMNDILEAGSAARQSKRSAQQMGEDYDTAIRAGTNTTTETFNNGLRALDDELASLSSAIDDVRAIQRGENVSVMGRENLMAQLSSAKTFDLTTFDNFIRGMRNSLNNASDGTTSLLDRQSSLFRSLDAQFREISSFASNEATSPGIRGLLRSNTQSTGVVDTLRQYLGGPQAEGMFGANVSELWTARNAAFERIVNAEEKILEYLGDKGGRVNAQRVRSKLRISTKGEDYVEQAVDDILEAVQDYNQGISDFAKLFGDQAGEAARLINKSQSRVATKLEDFISMARTVDTHNKYLRSEAANVASWGGMLGALGTGVAAVTGGLFGGVTGAVGLGALAQAGLQATSRPARTYATKIRIGKAMSDFTKKTQSGASAIKRKMAMTSKAGRVTREVGRGARSVAAVGFGRLFYDSPAEERGKEFFRIQQELRELSANPEELIDNLSVATETLEEISPETANALRVTAYNALSYLINNTPVVVTDPLFPDKMALPPSQSEVDDFLLRYRALHDPTVILHDFANNTLSQASVDTVRSVYPESFSAFQGIVGEILADTNPETIPYQTRLALSTFMGSQTDVTLSSDFVMAMQGRAAQTPQQASAQGMERMPARRINVSTSFLTEGQSLERMK